MSRSYRKPYIRDTEPMGKRFANKKIRQQFKLISFPIEPSYYKKIYDRYNLYEYNSYMRDKKYTRK